VLSESHVLLARVSQPARRAPAAWAPGSSPEPRGAAARLRPPAAAAVALGSARIPLELRV